MGTCGFQKKMVNFLCASKEITRFVAPVDFAFLATMEEVWDFQIWHRNRQNYLEHFENIPSILSFNSMLRRSISRHFM